MALGAIVGTDGATGLGAAAMSAAGVGFDATEGTLGLAEPEPADGFEAGVVGALVATSAARRELVGVFAIGLDVTEGFDSANFGSGVVSFRLETFGTRSTTLSSLRS